jgi:hypothetical protein
VVRDSFGRTHRQKPRQARRANAAMIAVFIWPAAGARRDRLRMKIKQTPSGNPVTPRGMWPAASCGAPLRPSGMVIVVSQVAACRSTSLLPDQPNNHGTFIEQPLVVAGGPPGTGHRTPRRLPLPWTYARAPGLIRVARTRQPKGQK